MNDFRILAEEEKQAKTDAHIKLIEQIRERNREREYEATFTEIWYTFVDPYATDVDERGNGKSFLYSLSLKKNVDFLFVRRCT